MKKNFILLAACIVCFAACNVNNPEKKELIGTWSEPYHVNMTVKSIAFYEDGTLYYCDKADTTWENIIDWGGDHAEMQYTIKKQQICFSGQYFFLNDEARRDSAIFKFNSGYSIEGNTLTIDSFAYDGGLISSFVKPLVLEKVK